MVQSENMAIDIRLFNVWRLVGNETGRGQCVGIPDAPGSGIDPTPVHHVFFGHRGTPVCEDTEEKGRRRAALSS